MAGEALDQVRSEPRGVLGRPRTLRPDVVLDTGEEPREGGWRGRELRLGDDVARRGEEARVV
jgi:hypothetical protein